MRLPLSLGLAALLFLSGCGDPKVVKVSGHVYLDDKPLPNVYVTFQPIGTKDNPAPGRGSYGSTDPDGYYELEIEPGVKGALAAKHRVKISTNFKKKAAFDPEIGSPDKAPPGPREKIPERYHEKSILEFDVPPEGTDKADFHLTMKSDKQR